MDDELNLSASFSPSSATGQKFKEFYDELKVNVRYLEDDGSYETMGYIAKFDGKHTYTVFSPDQESVLFTIITRGPEYTELDSNGQFEFIMNFFINAATRHRLLNSEEGIDAITADLRGGTQAKFTAKVTL